MPISSHNLFYIKPDRITKNKISIEGDEYHHLVNVLRKKDGDRIVATDGKGNIFEAKIVSMAGNRTLAEIVNTEHIERKMLINIALAFVPLKGARNDYVIEKGTELGVRTFLPFISKYSVVRDLRAAKLNRFWELAKTAMLQSQQAYLPEISFKKNLGLLAGVFGEFGSIFVAHKEGISDISSNKDPILLIVGPEGGFHNTEIDFFEEKGAQLLSLGPNRLRSETAAVCGLTKILTALKQL